MRLNNSGWFSRSKVLILGGFACFLIVFVSYRGGLLPEISDIFMPEADGGGDRQNPIEVPEGLPLDSRAFSGGANAFSPSESKDGVPIRSIPNASLAMVAEAERMSRDPFQFETTPDGNYLKINFKALSSFPLDAGAASSPEVESDPPLPEKIRDLHGKRVMIVGFMVPLEVDFRTQNVRLFAISQNMAFCCYGVTPGLNELVIVEMKPGRTSAYYDNVPIAVFGDFSVGKQADANRMASLYRLAADEVMPVKQFLSQSGRTP